MTTKRHRYRITVEHLERPDGTPAPEAPPLVFEAGNHDELGAIVERIRQRPDFAADRDEAAAFAIGLKLFGEVLLSRRDEGLFSEIGPAFGAFMRRLKGRPG